MIDTLEKYDKLVNKFVKKYKCKVVDFRNEYFSAGKEHSAKETKQCCQKYRNLVIKVISEVTEEFKKIYNINFAVILCGSFARESNTLFSDIDINYLVYQRCKDLIRVEEQMNFIFQQVFMYRGKDKIHSTIIFLPLVSNNKLDRINQGFLQMTFKNGVINIPCRMNSEEILYRTYNSTRKINDFINYLNQYDNETQIFEWFYCYKFINSHNYEKHFYQKRKEFRKRTNLVNLKNKLISSIIKHESSLNPNITSVENSVLKKCYKESVFFDFYNMLALFYRLDINISSFAINSFIKECYILDKNIFNVFYKYQDLVQTLQFILDRVDVDLSIHSNELIDLNYINNEYKKLTNRENIILDLNSCKKDVYNYCLNEMEKIKDE